MSGQPHLQQTLASLISGYSGATIYGNPSTPITDIVFDSRKVKSGDLFVALRGGYFDGHDFVDDAIQAGAAAVLVDDLDARASVETSTCAVVTVNNSRAALAEVAAEYYGHPSKELKLIGVTGTDGKTTTCFLLRQILEHIGVSTGVISTIAIAGPGQPLRSAGRQTTPESLEIQRLLRLMRDSGAEAVVLETSSHGLVTHRVDHCWFDIGVVTNVTSEHLDFHKTVDEYRAAKGSLLERVGFARGRGKTGIAILNQDDAGARGLRRYGEGCTIRTFSAVDRNSDVRASNINRTPDGYDFELSIDGQTVPVSLRMPGSWNVSNALAAAAASFAVSSNVDDIAAGLSLEPKIPGRMERVDVGQPFRLFVDYAHTPDALTKLLRELRETTDGHLMLLIGSAGERDTEKRPEIGRAAVTLSDFSVFSSEDPRFEDPEAIIESIALGATNAGAIREVQFTCIEDRRKAIRHILERAGPGDTIVIAGKGHETSMIYGSESRPWDEAEVAREVLRELGHEKEDVVRHAT